MKIRIVANILFVHLLVILSSVSASENTAQILFVQASADADDLNNQLLLLDSSGNVEEVGALPVGTYFLPSWSSNGEFILFTYSEDGSNFNLFTFNLETRALKQLTTDGLNWAGQISTDGTQALYWTDPPNAAIHSIDLTTGESEVLIADENHRMNPVWANRDQMIVYSKGVSGVGYELYSFDMISKVETRLTDGYGNAFLGAFPWNPDGNKIVFTSFKTGSFNLYILDYTTLEISTLTDDIHNNGQPSWSPDGKSIVFVKELNEDADIYTIDVIEKNMRQLTESNPIEYSPSWRPD